MIYYNKMKEEKQKRGLKRNTIDKFYTKDDIVKFCFVIISENYL